MLCTLNKNQSTPFASSMTSPRTIEDITAFDIYQSPDKASYLQITDMFSAINLALLL